ncbi:carboxylesterase/lipase family protein [Streptomyces sp. NPDC005248]|uniref:carboxylesterase/lipase family protein n=1 Tax=Streptomyces sp. NPDC005248 TaxID=3364709 RepID=UPI0036AD5678
MDTRKTNDGWVQGHRPVPDVISFLGIPYAAAPFGGNRFREPRPVHAWEGVRECKDFGPIAPQSARLPGAPDWSPGDEDILTLNIWAPSSDAGPLLPVLVWIHGGAYTFGSSAQPDFDGTALARAGVIVVTFNYRLGFEGFGHLPPGTGSPYPENRGLLDQIATLRWVRDNITAFGGDPANVTLAGQSCGAASAACLMVTEQARGLFRRVIAHSVASPCYSIELAAETTRKVAETAGIPCTADALVSAAPHTLVAASDRVVDDYRQDPFSGHRHYDPVIYGPVAGDGILTSDPLSATAAGCAREVDLLVCHTTQEYQLLDAVGSSAKVTTDDQLALFAKDFDLPDTLVPGYRALMPLAPVLDIYLAIFGDLQFSEYSTRLAERHAQSGGRTFMSRFARQRNGPAGAVYAWHCAGIPFAFGNLTAKSVEFLIGGPPSAEDHQLSRRMLNAWVSFATTGTPGWQPINDSTSGTPDGPSRSRAAAIHELWQQADFPLLRP